MKIKKLKAGYFVEDSTSFGPSIFQLKVDYDSYLREEKNSLVFLSTV